MESDVKKGLNPMTLGLIVIVVIAILAVGVVSMQSNNKDSTVTPTTTSGSTQTNETTTMMEPSEYKDGEYTVIGNYKSPPGDEEIGVTVTLAAGVITDVDVEVKAERPISKAKQEDFAANYKPLVVGKSIDEVELSVVSGASLTPKGFNDAIEKIKAEAKSS